MTFVHEGGIAWVPAVTQSNPLTMCVEGPRWPNANETVCCALYVLHRSKYALAPPTSCSEPGRRARADSEKFASYGPATQPPGAGFAPG